MEITLTLDQLVGTLLITICIVSAIFNRDIVKTMFGE